MLEGHSLIIIIVILHVGHERHRRTRRRSTQGPHLPRQDTGPGGIAKTHCHCTQLCNTFLHAPSLCCTGRAGRVQKQAFAHDQQRGDGTVLYARLGRSNHVWYGVCKEVFRRSSATSRRRPGHRPTAVPGGARRTPERRT